MVLFARTSSKQIVHRPALAARAWTCPNCGYVSAHPFCAQCGQREREHGRSIFQVLREIFGHDLSAEGRTPSTLFALCFRPGELTRAYIEGRRVRYLSPVRLYLLVTLSFFFALSASGLAIMQVEWAPQGADTILKLEDDADPAPGQPQQFKIAGSSITLPTDKHGKPLVPQPIFFKPAHIPQRDAPRPVVNLAEGDATFWQRLTIGISEFMVRPLALNQILERWLPRLFILLLPVMALNLAVLNWNRRFYFIDHLAFTLHGQSFAFVVGIISIIVARFWPDVELAGPATLLCLLYTILAWRRAYRGSWIGMGFKLLLLGLVYATLFLIGLGVCLMVGIESLGA